MKPEGRKTVKFQAKRDYHPRPKKVWINWWEDIARLTPRSTRKRRMRRELDDKL